MKTIDLSSGTIDLQEILRLAGESNLLLKTADGKEFLLAALDDMDEEVSLIRGQPELMALLAQRSEPAETFTVDQVKERLGLN